MPHTRKLQAAAGYSFVDRFTPNPLEVFTEMVDVGLDGHFEEKGRAAAYTMVAHLSDIPENEGFYREQAALHMVFISDEEDQSGANPISRFEFRHWMEGLKRSPNLVKAHGVFFIPGTSCPAGNTAGAEYQAYTNWTDGSAFSLCEQDWAPFVDDVVSRGPDQAREYFLSEVPITDPRSLQVNVVVQDDEGRDVTLGFSTCLTGEVLEDSSCRVAYSTRRNSVIFMDFTPEPLSEVLVTYQSREGHSAGSRPPY